MIITARQLDDLHRQNGSNGHVTLPYRARLTPLATDWMKAKRVAVGYSDVERPTSGDNVGTHTSFSERAQHAGCDCPSGSKAPGGAAHECACKSDALLWWCDGPCGPAKAALVAQERESSLRGIEIPADPKRIVNVIRQLAADVKAHRAAGGVLMVKNAAIATVFANRCPSLRAVLGTCIDAVDQGVQQVAANVLIVEYPYTTLQQMRNLLGRFVKARRELNEDVRRQLAELASCG